MAIVGITLVFRGEENVPAIRSDGRAATAITPSGTSQPSSITAEDSEYWEVATDTAIWVNFGSGTPVAAAGSTYYRPAGVWYWQAKVGDKCAVITA